MNQFYNKFKPNLWKKLIKILNNTFNNNFFLLTDLKQNVIEVDQCSWNLNINFQNRCVIPTHRHYMHIRSHNPVNNSKLMKNIQYNNNVTSRPMGHPALWATFSTTSNFKHLHHHYELSGA